MTSRTVEEVQEINRELVLHNQWLTRKGGRKADLSFRDLSGMEIRNIRLSSAKLVGANLARAKLSGCDLSGAELFGADLEEADLTGANLMGADFRGANLHRAVLTDCVLRGADFRTDRATTDTLPKAAHKGPTVMTEARLERAVLCEANLAGCDLSGADLDEADLTGADLSQAVLLGVELSGAVLSNVKLGNTVLELSRLSADQQQYVRTRGGVVEPAYRPMPAIEAAKLLESHERWIETNGADGRRLDLEFRRIEGALLSARDLSGARLRRCCLKGADLARVRLDMADLSYCDLGGANLEQASLRGANLRRANLSRALMASCCLDAMPMVGGREWPTNLDGALLHDADLTNASFVSAVLRNADIGGSMTQGACFRGVDLGTVKRTAPGEGVVGPRERRRMRRFTAPVLQVKTQFGQFPTYDWSFGGLSLDLRHGRVTGEIPRRSATVTLLVGVDGHPGGDVPVSAILSGASTDRGTISFRFVKLEDELKGTLNLLIPPRYRLK